MSWISPHSEKLFIDAAGRGNNSSKEPFSGGRNRHHKNTCCALLRLIKKIYGLRFFGFKPTSYSGYQ